MEVAETDSDFAGAGEPAGKKCIENNETISVGLKAVILSSNKIQRKTALKMDFTVEISRTSYYDKHVE